MANAMSSRAVIWVSCIIILMKIGSVWSDFAKDKEECGDELTSFSTCLPFVSGEKTVPSVGCCANMREKINATQKCLCLIVLDRNDPKLGLKINATLALSLPSICHAPANISQCPEILHLPPNSTDAQVFEQFNGTSNSSQIVVGKPRSSSSRLSKKEWLQMGMASGILSFLNLCI